jgi:hypothetical protein
MFIESRPVTGYGETAGWALPLLPQEPVPRVPLRRPQILTAKSSTPSLQGMEQTIPPAPKRPPFASTDTASTVSSGLEHTIMPFQEFVKRTPPPEENKPLPPTPLRVWRSSFGDDISASSREPSVSRPRRTSSVYSRTVSQWLPDSPVWSASDLEDNPLPALPPEFLQPIAYSASTPALVEKVPNDFLLQPRTYQPLLTTPSPTISRRTTPSPAPTASPRDRRSSILLPTAVDVAAIPKSHLRTVSLEKAKATSSAPGAEHLLPEELRAKSRGLVLSKTRSLEPIVKAPQPTTEKPKPIVRDTLAMLTRAVDLPPSPPPSLPTMTLVDAEGRDRMVGAPRLSVAPLPTFSFPVEPVRSPVHTTINAFPVGKNAPLTMVSLTAQNHPISSPALSQTESHGHERGRSIQRGLRDSGFQYYQPSGRRRESSSSARGDSNAHQMAQDYYSLLAEQHRQAPASASSASRSMNSDVEVGEHMRMVPQPLFHSKPAAMQHRQTRSRYDSTSGSVSPFLYRQQSDTSSSMHSQHSGSDRLPSTPYRLSINTNDRRRSSIGTIPISPPFQYTDNTDRYPAAMQAVPQTRASPKYRRNSDDNRVSAYWHIPTKGGSNELVFRRSKEKHPSIPKIIGPGSPNSPGVPLLAPDVVAQRLQTPEATAEHSPLLQRPWGPAQHATSYSTASSLPSPGEEEEEDPNNPNNNNSNINKPPKELTAKQALLARFTKGAVKYADKLTRPTGYEPRSSSPLSTTSNDQAHPNSSSSARATARTESTHLLPSPTNPTKPPPAKAKSHGHAHKPSLGWSPAAKSAFDSHHSPSPHPSSTHNHKPTPSQSSIYFHTSTPARTLDERGSGGDLDEETTTAGSSVRRGSINLFATLRDLRRETRAEKRREEIKKSIRVVGVPEGVEAGAGFGGSGSEVRGRSAEGRRSGVDENVNVGVRPQSGGGGWGVVRSVSWMGGAV